MGAFGIQLQRQSINIAGRGWVTWIKMFLDRTRLMSKLGATGLEESKRGFMRKNQFQKWSWIWLVVEGCQGEGESRAQPGTGNRGWVLVGLLANIGWKETLRLDWWKDFCDTLGRVFITHVRNCNFLVLELKLFLNYWSILNIGEFYK